MGPASITSSDHISERKARWDSLQNMIAPCPPVWVVIFDGELGTRPYPWPSNIPARVEWAWNTYVRELDRLAWLDDGRIPCLDPYSGTEIFAAAFGCNVFRPSDNMPFALPLIDRTSQAAALRVPSIDVEPLGSLFAIADELRRRAGPNAVMRLPDIQSPFDIAALIWEKKSFYTALLDYPDVVQELTAKVEALVAAFLDEWFRRYGLECVAHYPHYYMRRGVSVSVDEVGAISSRMGAAFVMPELVRLSGRYDGIGVHCCANAHHQWANFSRLPGLRLLNLFGLERPGILHEAAAYFAGCVSQLHNWEEPFSSWLPSMPSTAHVAFEVTVLDEEEARRVVALLGDAYLR